jgi:hypothetical protein
MDGSRHGARAARTDGQPLTRSYQNDSHTLATCIVPFGRMWGNPDLKSEKSNADRQERPDIRLIAVAGEKTLRIQRKDAVNTADRKREVDL